MVAFWFPSAVYPRIRVQTFHEDCDLDAAMNGWLPDEMRRVLITDSLARECGFTLEEQDGEGTMTELAKAIWFEGAYQIGRCYDMSTDSIRPRKDFVSREHFARVCDAGGFIHAREVTDLEARAWVWRWVRSATLTMDQVIERAGTWK